MFNLLHTYTPDAVAFAIGGFAVRWYGLMIGLGMVVGVALVVRLAARYNLDRVYIYDFLFWALIAGIVGARLYYVLYAWEYYHNNLWEVFALWHGGLAIHGALIAGLLVVIGYARRHQLNTWQFLDIIVVGVVIGQMFGRLGNYFNQELFGMPTDLPWGIPISPDMRPEQYADATHFHPTFLYEILLNGVVFVVLLLLHRFRLTGRRLPDGTIALSYCIGYGCVRFFTELFRVDFTPFVFGIRWAQFVSMVLVIVGGSILIQRLYKVS